MIAWHQNGGARIPFHGRWSALHGMQVVLDQVYNHRPQADVTGARPRRSGYYQRLSASGEVETSTCCSNVVTEECCEERLHGSTR